MKTVSAKEAIRQIRPGRRILIGSGAAEPAALIEAMVAHGDHLSDNSVVHLMTLGPAPYVQPAMQGRFRHTAFFIGANVRQAVQEGRADFMPVFLSEIPRLITTRRVPVDVAIIQVSPPDARGFVSLGVSVDIVRAAVESAELVLAEINPQMPRTLGASFLHVDDIDYAVLTDAPLPELPPNVPDEVSAEIGRHVASLIPDGATIQVGIGKIPDAVMAALGDHRDLGLHTEMFSDGVMNLVEGGAINGRRKSMLKGKLVTSFIMGSRKLYDWVDDHPAVEMRPSDFTNDPAIIARNERMVAVNAALAVDLTGQVAADTLMGRFFSGIGGQVDFIRGAARSEGGRAIIAMTSTVKSGTISRIMPALEEGAGVVTSRGDVHYVVTEHGIADLWGKNIRQRAMRLIEIAHPDFRADLLAAAKQRRYVFADQVSPRLTGVVVKSRNHTLPGGEEVIVRPVRLTDEERLQDLFYRLSEESTYRRFMGHKSRHSHDEMQKLVDLDYQNNVALIVSVPHYDRGEIVGMTRYDVAPATGLADIAFVVQDEWQGKGIGRLLIQRMSEIARSRGVPGFTADVLASNRAMLAVFQKSGLELKMVLRDGAYRLTALIPKESPE